MILAGSGTMISQQRYKDTASRTQYLIQEQYASTVNTLNARQGSSWRCNPATGEVSQDSGEGVGAQWRGASECEILGRFIQFNGNGREIITGNVTGYRFQTTPSPTNDLQAFGQYHLARMTEGSESRPVSWGASITHPTSEAIDNELILILRSPFSGTLRTFITSAYHPFNGEVTIPNSLLVSFNGRAVLCINPEGFSIGEKLGIVIEAGASGTSAIKQQASGSGC